MATFTLTQDNRTFTLDLTGRVSEDGDNVGLWTTGDDGAIVIVPAAADATLPFDFDAAPAPIASIPVVWKWNDNNQLTLHSAGGDEVVNLNKADDNFPLYRTHDAVLLVNPDIGHTFQFALRPQWDLDDNHDLTMTVSGTTSVIDGVVQDQRSRFMYHFSDKEDIVKSSVLGFVGNWESLVVDGEPKLKFHYEREGEDEPGVFELPAALTVDRGSNQLLYRYDKENQTHEIKLLGFLSISENFEITYALDRQISSNGEEQVAATSLSLQARYVNQSFSSVLQLQFTKDDGTGGTVLEIGGAMTAVLGQTRLQVAFAFQQVRENQLVTTSFGFNGSLEFRNGRIEWLFEHNAEQTSLTVAVSNIRLGAARFDSRLNVVAEDGTVVGIRALFGITF